MMMQFLAMRGEEGLTVRASARGGSPIIGARATMAASSQVGDANELRELKTVQERVRARCRKTHVSFEAPTAMAFSSRIMGSRSNSSLANFIPSEGKRAIGVGRGRSFSKAALAAMLQSSNMEDILCSSFVGSRVQGSIPMLPHFKAADAIEAGDNLKGKRRRHIVMDALAATAEIVQSSGVDEEISFATKGNCAPSGLSSQANDNEEVLEGKNIQVSAKRVHAKRSASAAIAPSRKGTLIGGVDGGRRQDGKIILPHFTISEAKETTQVCRVLKQEGEWTPRVEQALYALSPKLNTRILARILKLQTKPSLAWKLFQWAESLTSFTHDSYTFYALVEVLGKANDVQALWTLIDDIRIAGIRLKPIPFTFLISSYGRAGKVKEAEITLHSMREFKCKPNVYTYNAILYALLKAHKTERALFTYSKMLHYGCRPDVVTFNTLISGLCLSDHADLAACFLEEMLKQGFSPDIRICNGLIGKYLKLGQLQEALNVYDIALKRGCKPNTITHTMLLDWLFKMGKFDDALVLFKEMASSGCDLDTVAFTAFLHGLFKSNKVEMAFTFFESLVMKGYANVATFNIVVDWFCKHQKVDHAVEVLHDMRRRGISPDTFTYNSLICSAFKDSRPLMGLAFASQMMDEGCTPDLITYTLMVEFFLKEGELDDALTLMKEMTDNGYEPDTVIYNPLILGLFRAGKDEMALSTVREMMQKGCRPNKMTYRILNSWLCKQGHSKDALEFKKEMTSLGCNPTLLQIPDAGELMCVWYVS